MPVVTLNNNVFKVTDVVVDCDDQGYYVRLNVGHCDAVVLCVSQYDPISQQDLNLSEADLQRLFLGGRLENAEKGYMLQGITRQQIAGTSRYRNFQMTPPAFVQVWGMKQGGLGTELMYPEDMTTQMWRVPVVYSYTCAQDALQVSIKLAAGYQDGDLMYRVAGHLGIPIPKAYINRRIPLHPGTAAEVVPAPGAEEKYIYKSAL
jgi:hypothetical protein